MAGHQPESRFSAESSQLCESVLWANPGKAMDSKDVTQFLYCIENNISNYDLAQ